MALYPDSTKSISYATIPRQNTNFKGENRVRFFYEISDGGMFRPAPAHTEESGNIYTQYAHFRELSIRIRISHVKFVYIRAKIQLACIRAYFVWADAVFGNYYHGKGKGYPTTLPGIIRSEKCSSNGNILDSAHG